MPENGTIVGHGQAGTAIVGGHQADGVRAIFSRQTDSGRRVADVAGEKQIHRRAEEIFVLQKERTLLRKIDGVALVDGDLRIFGLDLAEVRIRGHVDDEVIMDDELRVHAGLALHRRRSENRDWWESRVSSARKPRIKP